MLIYKKENKKILKIMEDVLDEAFDEKAIKKLAKYMGGELTINPPNDEKTYQEHIKNPMVNIFNQYKNKLEKKLGKKIYNNPYEPINDELYLSVGLIGMYGWVYYVSSLPDLVGPVANTFMNSPLQKNLINGIKNSNGTYSPFNANTIPSQMEVLLHKDPNHCAHSIGFFPMQIKKTGFRICRKLINNYTGINGGVIFVLLYNYND